MMSAIQKHLREGGNIDNIAASEVRIAIHPEYKNLHLFIYSDFADPLNDFVRTSRGHILDAANNWEHVCRPFDRFYNLGQYPDAAIAFKNPKFVKKEDGSLINLWYYDGSWRVSTKGAPSAGGNVWDTGEIYSEHFWKIWKELNYNLPDDKYIGKTFTFELCSKENTIVCTQVVPKIVLIGVRDNISGQEYWPTEFAHLNWQIVETYDIKNIDEASKSFKDLSGLESEGYILVEEIEGIFCREKFKNPDYIRIHRLKTYLSEKIICEKILDGTIGELSEKIVLPGLQEKIETWANYCAGFKSYIIAEYAKYSGVESRKSFAAAIVNHLHKDILFGLLSKDIDQLMKELRLEVKYNKIKKHFNVN